jgi:hypothetical protein
MSDTNLKSVPATRVTRMIEGGKVFSSRAKRSLVAVSHEGGKVKVVRSRARATYNCQGQRQYVHDVPSGYLCSGESRTGILKELADL